MSLVRCLCALMYDVWIVSQSICLCQFMGRVQNWVCLRVHPHPQNSRKRDPPHEQTIHLHFSFQPAIFYWNVIVFDNVVKNCYSGSGHFTLIQISETKKDRNNPLFTKKQLPPPNFFNEIREAAKSARKIPLKSRFLAHFGPLYGFFGPFLTLCYTKTPFLALLDIVLFR